MPEASRFESRAGEDRGPHWLWLRLSLVVTVLPLGVLDWACVRAAPVSLAGGCLDNPLPPFYLTSCPPPGATVQAQPRVWVQQARGSHPGSNSNIRFVLNESQAHIHMPIFHRFEYWRVPISLTMEEANVKGASHCLSQCSHHHLGALIYVGFVLKQQVHHMDVA